MPKHKFSIIKESKYAIAEICEYCNTFVIKLKSNKRRYLVEEPYHPVGCGKICPKTCEETSVQIVLDS